MINSLKKLLFDRKFINYAIIGVTGVALDFILYIILVRAGMSPIIASVISVSIAIVNNFILNAYLNFKKRDYLLARFLSFYGVGVLGVFLSALFIYVFNSAFGINALIAKALSVPFIVIFQYWLNKSASFAESTREIPWRQMSPFIIGFAVITLFITAAPLSSFSDEYDNLLGGQFIANGGVIYGDYFSHHMPLQYFLMAPLFWLFESNLVAVKTAYALAMSAWLLMMTRHILRKYGVVVYAVFTLLVSISLIPSWAHMVLAEVFVAFALCHALILLFLRKEKWIKSQPSLITIGILGSIPILSSLAYAPISILIYAIGIYIYFDSYKRIVLKLLLPPITIAALPYIGLVSYLFFTKTAGEFIDQTLKFNSKYYSQFSSDAPRGLLDSGLAILDGSINSLLRVFSSFGSSSPALLASLIVISLLIVGTYTLYTQKRWPEIIFFGIAIIFSTSRNGFTEILANNGSARNGFVIYLVCILLTALAVGTLMSMNNSPVSSKHRKQLLLISAAGITLLFLMAAGPTINAHRQYLKTGYNIELLPHPNSPQAVVNIVNSPGDYYWVGPLDFGSQIYITSENVSSYRFYAPWHAVCSECTDQLISDITALEPRVISISIANNNSLWSIPVKDYSDNLISSFEERYYQVKDPLLTDYYFLKDDMNDINKKLIDNGYNVEIMEAVSE